MTENQKKFAIAALEVFKRFGVRKATMEEIAQQAGVSKPTLYSVFRNKDQALAATIRLAKGVAVDEVQARWSTLDETSAKIDVFFDRLVIAGFDLLHSSPDAGSFENSIGEASAQAIKDTRRMEADLLTAALAGHTALAERGTSPEAYAQFIVDAAMQAKRESVNRKQLQAFLAALKISILATLELTQT